MDSSKAGVLLLYIKDAFSHYTGSANRWPLCFSKELLGVSGGVGYGSIYLVIVSDWVSKLLNIFKNKGLAI